MSGLSAEQRHQLIERLLRSVDPRLAVGVREEFARLASSAAPGEQQTVVIAGHRAAGKSRLLPLVGVLLGRPGLDLDHELERRTGRSLKEWVSQDMEGFRRAERELFLALPPGGLVAVGGGFLSHHPEALASCYTLLIPISFETYRERLMHDTGRPRLRLGVTLEEELHSIYHQRQELHGRVNTRSLSEFLRALSSRGEPTP